MGCESTEAKAARLQQDLDGANAHLYASQLRWDDASKKAIDACFKRGSCERHADSIPGALKTPQLDTLYRELKEAETKKLLVQRDLNRFMGR